LGFVPIDTSQIGLYGDPDWVRAPRQIERQPYIPKPPVEPGPTTIEDDFEDSIPDAPPDGPVLSVENVGGILVTGELASSGKQSLKFTDAPGQKYGFNPHIWYSPHLTAGTVRGSFDARIEPGAVGYFAWRDYEGGAYRVGPSLRIEGDGKLLAGDRQLGKVPLSQWLRIEITCGLGDTANGKWTLRYGPIGGKQTEAELTCDPNFRKLDWVGFVADATVAAVFYVDNLKIGPSPTPTP
ncbi:MAG: hypothetical protein NTW96_16340, partial [Planctomycetia bacterium]|nr:hypothetical protein [Planctomycetia bacterium]